MSIDNEEDIKLLTILTVQGLIWLKIGIALRNFSDFCKKKINSGIFYNPILAPQKIGWAWSYYLFDFEVNNPALPG